MKKSDSENFYEGMATYMRSLKRLDPIRTAHLAVGSRESELPTYTVSERTQAEIWNGQSGPMQAWDLTLVKEGIPYICQANTQIKDGVINEFPAIGEQVEGTIENKKGREVFKRAYGGGSPSRGSGSFQRDPKESASIVRQHSQQMAITWAAILDKKGLLPDRPDYVWLTGVIDWFQRDAKGEPQS